MSAGIYNSTLEQGATFERTFDFSNADGSAFDFTGYSFAAQLRRFPKDTGTPVATFTCTLVLPNSVTISLTPLQTTNVLIPVIPDPKNPVALTRYYYDLFGTGPTTKVKKLIAGYLDVYPEVTK